MTAIVLPTTQITDVELTEKNRKFIKEFLNDIFVLGNFEKMADYINKDKYIQHNPMVKDGLSGLMEYFAKFARENINLTYTNIHLILAENDLVLVVTEGSLGGRAVSIYDIFRIENDKIVEHWDNIEYIPPLSEFKNNNGKFGFMKNKT